LIFVNLAALALHPDPPVRNIAACQAAAIPLEETP
jgi:hypothetical protein